jgi:hypothetical protein
MNRWLAVLAVGFFLAGAVTSCSSGPSTPAPLYSAKDATKVTAQELYGAYTKHQAASDKLFKGKLLEVTGVIHDVGTDPLLNDSPEVMLSGGAMNQALGVDCTFDTRYASEVAKLKTGQTMSVLGVCDGFAVNVLLLHCQPAKE